LLRALGSRFQLGYMPALLLDESGVAPSDLQIEVTKDRELFLKRVVERDLDLIVISDEKDLPDATRVALVGLIQRHVHFERLDRFYELILRRIPIGMITDLWFLENIDLKGRLPYRMIKRALDLVVSFLGLVISLPFWLLIAAGIKLGSRGPVLYTQIRLGFLGKPFRIVKFRTMRMDGNDLSPTASSDPRITAFGSFLRKTRLDEIPQFLNILRGEMSLVGPRPERPELVAQLENEVPFYRQRLLAKPGVTGWDQVSGEYHSPSVADTFKKLQYDLYYVKNVSVILDVSIFFKTIMTVLGRSGR
jgi:lipopolysaccharide/colanic/teichoic acid biosynthesis glycosyltransferase